MVVDGGRDSVDASERLDGETPPADAETDPDSGEMNGVDADMPDVDAGADSDAGGMEEMRDGGSDGGTTVVPSCMDGSRNGDETGVDCGGPTCEARCPDLGRCTISSDCASRVCIGGTCIAPACTDGIRNGDETGADCGGPTCAGCGLGQACASEDDCAVGTCSGGFCVADHCFDAVRNVNETDVDCGGADCAPCNAGEQCRTSRDCNMSTCEGGYCLTPECSNGMPDMGEVDVDCGGDCPGCADGTACTMGADCLSGRCEGGYCTSCSDGAQNGAETGVDCGGGVCRGCPAAEACTGNDDCASRVCTAGVCEGAASFYRESFDTSDGGWTASGAPWEYAVPAGTALTAAYTGTSVWITDADADYLANADATVTSPMIDLSAATTDPLLRLAVIYESESSYDLTWVEMSVDGGAFARVGSRTSGGTNWYNSTRSSTSAQGWASTSSPTWRIAEHPLVGGAGHMIQLRLHFVSDGSGQYEGFAFDDVEIAEDVCGNGIADPAETDVDCGGELCAACDDGLNCLADTDCASGVCDLGTCVSCGDEIENGGETDLDCGGEDCAPCGDTQGCSVDTDCLSGRCEAGACTSCFDGVLNGGETFIDCGGGGCGLCLGGATCTANEQCLSGACTGGVCEAPPATALAWTFDTDGEGWTSEGGLWEYGAPAGTFLNTPYTGTGVWITDADANYPNSADATVTSPLIDLRSITRDPSLRMAISYRAEGSYDVTSVEMAIDGGAFTRVGTRTDGGTNWYDSNSSARGEGWANSSGVAWRVAEHILNGAAGHEVQLRVRFRSDTSGTYDGFMFDDVEIVPSIPDLAVTLAPSATLCDGVVVTVRNEGSLPVSFFDLITNVDGTMSTTRVTRLIEPGGTYTVELRASSAIEASVRAVGDSNASNDTAMFDTTPRTIGARYVETFESGAGDWVSTGTNSSWAYGTPSDTFIMNASSGANAWVTNLTNNYNADEASYLVSPCFDFSGFGTDPTMSFSYIVDTQPTVDHSFVEISTNGGETWEKLGLFGTGSNWYNDLAGDFWDGRAGAAGEWIRATHPLVGAAGHGAVRVRVAFVSNMNVQREGMGIDDVIVMP